MDHASKTTGVLKASDSVAANGKACEPTGKESKRKPAPGAGGPPNDGDELEVNLNLSPILSIFLPCGDDDADAKVVRDLIQTTVTNIRSLNRQDIITNGASLEKIHNILLTP